MEPCVLKGIKRYHFFITAVTIAFTTTDRVLVLLSSFTHIYMRHAAGSSRARGWFLYSFSAMTHDLFSDVAQREKVKALFSAHNLRGKSCQRATRKSKRYLIFTDGFPS